MVVILVHDKLILMIKMMGQNKEENEKRWKVSARDEMHEQNTKHGSLRDQLTTAGQPVQRKYNDCSTIRSPDST
jgi:hypothetical protein